MESSLSDKHFGTRFNTIQQNMGELGSNMLHYGDAINIVHTANECQHHH